MLGDAQVLYGPIPFDSFEPGRCLGCKVEPRIDRVTGEQEPVVALMLDGLFNEDGTPKQAYLCRSCLTLLGSLVGLESEEAQKIKRTDVRRQERRDSKTRAAGDAVLLARDASFEAAERLHELAHELGLEHT